MGTHSKIPLLVGVLAALALAATAAFSLTDTAPPPGDSQSTVTVASADRADDTSADRGDRHDAEEADWHSTKNKWVPILTVGQEGVRAGAAQIAGPSRAVDKAKAVMQLRLDYKGVARVYVYIPSSTMTGLNRVQGVSVWATGDIGLVNF